MPESMKSPARRFAALWVLMLVFALPLRAEPLTFTFVQITDTHLGIPENDRRTRKIVDAVNALPMTVACVVHTGDIYDRRVRENPEAAARAAAVFAPLRVPVYFVPGNHEIDLFRMADRTEAAYTKAFGPLSYSKPVAGMLFVFTYSDPLREGVSLPGFDPLDSLRQELEKSHGAPVLLFHHCPSVEDFYANRLHPGWNSHVREHWVRLINRFNVKAVIAGHFHRDECHWLGDVPLYVSGPVAEKYGRQAGYRIYEYKDGRLSYTTQYLE